MLRAQSMPRLVITKGVGTGRDHAIGPECVLGRAPDVDFVLEDVGISRRHCRVRPEGAGFVVEDLGSRNGTLVNGNRVQLHALVDGDVLRTGGVEMVFRSDAVAAPAAVVTAVAAPAPVPVAKAVVVPKILTP